MIAKDSIGKNDKGESRAAYAKESYIKMTISPTSWYDAACVVLSSSDS